MADPTPKVPDGIAVAGSRGAASAGRSLRATRAFPAGSTIAVFDDPLVVLPATAAAKAVCNSCLSVPATDTAGAEEEGTGGAVVAKASTVRLCTGCRCVAYCGAECQRRDWARVHARECRAFKMVRRETGHDWLPTPVRALTQLLLRWEGGGGKGSKGGRGDGGGQGELAVRDAVGLLEGNTARFEAREQMWRDLSLQAIAAMMYAGWQQVDENMRVGREVLCKIQTNSFDRADADSGQSGVFLHPTLAMINHSCVPNAIVCFFKRKAFLRAEADIKAGDMITISYVDYTKPKLQRQRGLELYHFECQCPRCRDDLSVYEVCRQSPDISLNSLSFMPHLDRLRNPAPCSDPRTKSAAFRTRIAEMYDQCAPETETPLEARLARLRHQWRLCRPLRETGMWAASPLDQVISSAAMYYAEKGTFANALAVSCFASMNCDPYKYVFPYKQWRLKGLMVIAKSITNTAPAMGELEKTTHPAVAEVLKRADQVSICEALLLMVSKFGHLAHSEDWDVVTVAKVMLADIGSLPGREKESGLLKAWISDRDDPAGQAFFDGQILKPMEDLAGFAVELLTAELGP